MVRSKVEPIIHTRPWEGEVWFPGHRKPPSFGKLHYCDEQVMMAFQEKKAAQYFGPAALPIRVRVKLEWEEEEKVPVESKQKMLDLEDNVWRRR